MPVQRRPAAATADRRLCAVGCALRAAGAPEVGAISATLKPLPLDVAGGGVAAWKLDEIDGRKRSALEAEDYRLASEMSDLHIILSAVSPPPCASSISICKLPIGTDVGLNRFNCFHLRAHATLCRRRRRTGQCSQAIRTRRHRPWMTRQPSFIGSAFACCQVIGGEPLSFHIIRSGACRIAHSTGLVARRVGGG